MYVFFATGKKNYCAFICGFFDIGFYRKWSRKSGKKKPLIKYQQPLILLVWVNGRQWVFFVHSSSQKPKLFCLREKFLQRPQPEYKLNKNCKVVMQKCKVQRPGCDLSWQGRRNVKKNGWVKANVVGIICPLIRIPKCNSPIWTLGLV